MLEKIIWDTDIVQIYYNKSARNKQTNVRKQGAWRLSSHDLSHEYPGAYIYEADLGAASAKVIEDWKDKGREVLYVGHYYGGAGEYVARYCLVRQREGAAEQEYELENASLHELTLYFDETGMVYAFLPFPAQAVSGYGRLYGIQKPRPSGSSDKKDN